MAEFNTSVADKILKVFYLPPVREMLNNSTILLSRLEKTVEGVQGKNFTVPVHYGRSNSVGIGLSETGTLPSADYQKYTEAIIPLKRHYSTMQVSGVAIAATKSSAGAFVKAIESEMKGLMNDTKRAINRQLHGDGKDALAYWTATDNATPVVVDDGNGFAFTHLPNGTVTCDLIDAGDNSTKNGDSITFTLGAEDTSTPGWSISWSAGSVSNSADGDYLVLEDTLGYQMMGIAGVISASDPVVPAGGGSLTGLHGLAVASNPWWTAQVVGSDSSKVDLSIANMQKVFSKIASGSDYSEKDIKFLLCSYGVRDKYVELCTAERRYYNTMTLDGGFEAVTFNGKPIVPDPQCKRGRLYFIVPESMAIFRMNDFDWMDKDGNTFYRVSGRDAYAATLFHYGDLGCKVRNANGVLLGINE